MQALELLAPFGFHPTGVVHIGANSGVEYPAYLAADVVTAIYVEPVPDAYAKLRARIDGTPGHHAIRALCSRIAGEMVTFNIADNQGESSSLFGLGNHGLLYPAIRYTDSIRMVTTTVDDILDDAFADATLNLLVIDVQGAELLVLQGAERALERIEAVYCEVADISLYEDSCTWDEIRRFLAPTGFCLKYLGIGVDHCGNALFLKESAYWSPLRVGAIAPAGLNLAIDKPAKQSSTSIFSRPNDAQGGVNGRVTGSFGFHTAKEQSPWWQVDLLQPIRIGNIRVFNRLDACRTRGYALLIRAGLDEDHLRVVHAQRGRPFGGADGHPLSIPLGGSVARFLRIELTTLDYLHLDEVEIYGVVD